MSDELRLEGLGVAPGVLDTIVTVAVEDVEGVASIGAPGLAGLVQKGSKGASRAVDVCANEDGSLTATIHIQVLYGHALKDVATGVQAAVADAVASQVGVSMAAVDVFIDGIVFAE
jgi:uncharacterized alkaline shock family protein YloU